MFYRKWHKWVRIVKEVSIILTCLYIIVSLWSIKNSFRQTQLTKYSETKELLDEQHALHEKIYNVWLAYPNISTNIADNHPSGWSLYHSNNILMREFVEVGHHYEQIGALVKTNYLDFAVYSEIYDFPDSYWNRTKPLIVYMRKNWNADNGGKTFEKYLCNFEYLSERYQRKRHRAELSKKLRRPFEKILILVTQPFRQNEGR
ncbi:hypothetical protein GMSM_43020 [Geomonas sp. Red276]